MDTVCAVREYVGRQVKIFREKRGWSMAELGRRIHKSKSTISRIEHGKQNVTLVDVVLLALALGVPPGVLFPPVESANGGIAELERRLLRAFRGLHERGRLVDEVYV